MATMRRVTDVHTMRADMVEVGDVIRNAGKWHKVTGFGDATRIEGLVVVEFVGRSIANRDSGPAESWVHTGMVTYQDFDLVEVQVDKIIKEAERVVHMEYGGRELGHRI